mgnify:CR=1 FL=1
MASKSSFAPTRGMRDFYPEDMAVRNAVFQSWTRAGLRFGFVPYDACVVESLDLLKRKAGEEIVEQIYAFKDKSGRDLALRPEMTPTLARMVAARQSALSFPLKWHTIAQCFRYERTTKGRKREHYQWNLDIIGEPAVTAEAEVIAAAADAMAQLHLGAEHYRIHISSRRLLTELLARAGVADEHHAAAFLALDKRGKQDDDSIREILGRDGIPKGTIDAIFTLMQMDSLDEVREALGNESRAMDELQDLFKILHAHGLADVVAFDLSVIRGLAYYTGIVFEAFDTGQNLRAIFGGGRYDNLLSDIGGKQDTAVGLGFGDVVLTELLQDHGIDLSAHAPDVLAVGYMTDAQRDAAVKVAADMRDRGRNVDLALHSEKPRNFFSRCNKSGCAEAIYIGPDDVEQGTCRLKTLATRQEETIALE